MIIWITLLLAAGFILLLIKYISLKRTVYNALTEQRKKHEKEMKTFKQQFYYYLHQDFKTPFIRIQRTLDKFYKEEKNSEKKLLLEEAVRKIKLINHKLNRWPNKGEIEEDYALLNKIKREFHLYIEEMYPGEESASLNTILKEEKNMQQAKSHLQSLSGELFNQQLTRAEEKLLISVIDYIRKNLENPDMSVQMMSKSLGISRNHLHRKLKALTGQSPVEFIKTIRMSYAAHLLQTGRWSISDVGYKVGYNTPSYFSSSFHAHFGMSPTQYIQNLSQQKVIQ